MEGRKWNWRNKEDGMRSWAFGRHSKKQFWIDSVQGIMSWDGETGAVSGSPWRGRPTDPAWESHGSPSFKCPASCRWMLKASSPGSCFSVQQLRCAGRSQLHSLCSFSRVKLWLNFGVPSHCLKKKKKKKVTQREVLYIDMLAELKHFHGR